MNRAGRHERCSDDQGVALILVALLMVVLLVMSAFAVDLGKLYAERRQDQSAADAGVLSGSWQLLLGTNKTDQAIFNEVTRLTYEDLDRTTRPASLAAWRTLWGTCSDPGAVARGFTKPLKVSGKDIDCITKSANGRALRVQLPDRKVDTVFASVIGIDTLGTGAFAEAGIIPRETNILPFAISSAATLSSGLSCLLTAPNGLAADDCTGSYQGNFGHVASPRPSLVSNQNCNGGQSNTLAENIAQGLDHFLTEDPDPISGDSAEIADACQGPAVPDGPNKLFLQTGSISGDPDDVGLLGAGPFDDGGAGRLTRGACTITRQVRQGDQPIDNCGLWEYFRDFTASDVGLDTAAEIPQACYDGVSALLNDGNAATNPTKVTMKACLDVYDAGGYTTDLVTTAIAESARFAWIPESWEDLTTCTGSCSFTVKRFRTVYLQTTWFKQGNSFRAFNPGEAFSPTEPKNSGFAQLSAFVLNPEIIPSSVIDEGPTRGIPSIGLLR